MCTPENYNHEKLDANWKTVFEGDMFQFMKALHKTMSIKV